MKNAERLSIRINKVLQDAGLNCKVEYNPVDGMQFRTRKMDCVYIEYRGQLQQVGVYTSRSIFSDVEMLQYIQDLSEVSIIVNVINKCIKDNLKLTITAEDDDLE